MEDQAAKPSEHLARQLRHWRDERKLSVQALANRVAEIGGTLSRVAISKIENGDRGVSLDEWLQLAHALAVPPPLLFLDFRTGADVAITPDIRLHPWVVWEWVGGEHASPVPAPEGGAYVSRVEEFGRAKTAIYLYRREGKAAAAVGNAQSAIRSAEYVGDQEQVRAARSAHADALRELATVLDEMVENGMTPPSKPGEWVEAIRELRLSRHPEKLVAMGNGNGQRQ